VAVFVLVVGAVFAFTVTREGDDPSPSSSSGRTTGTDPATGSSSDGSIGPLTGADVGAYVDGRKQALNGAVGDGMAVVSLEGYASEVEARAAVGSAKVEALLAAAPGAHPSVVTEGLEAWAKSQRQADEAERNEIQKLLPTVDAKDPFKAFYESELDRLDTAIESVSPTSQVVFGLVVRGPAEALKALGAAPGVRLVDVGKPVDAKSGAVFRGLRPEETTKVGQPATRPV